MIIFGIILLIIGFVAKLPALWGVGIFFLLMGLFAALIGLLGRTVGGRRHFY